jgi:hypothetical protein
VAQLRLPLLGDLLRRMLLDPLKSCLLCELLRVLRVLRGDLLRARLVARIAYALR